MFNWTFYFGLYLKHNYLKSINDNTVRNEVSKLILAYVLTEDEASHSIESSGYVAIPTMHNKFDKIVAALK